MPKLVPAIAWRTARLEGRARSSAAADPVFDTLQDHPRFEELARRIGVPGG